MKTLSYIAVFFTLLFAFSACEKGNVTTVHLEAAHATIKIGQTDTLELVGAAATDSVKWTVTPPDYCRINSLHNHAVVIFYKAGVYTITTVVNNAGSYSYTYIYTITVTNEVYNPTPPSSQATHISITGDQITLLSHYNKSTNSDSAYVYFNAKTTNNYSCGNSYLNYTHSLDASNHFSINFIDMYQPAPNDCTTGGTTITSPVIPFVQSLQNNYLANGTYPLTVSLNGVTYTGSIAITATDVTFNWTYTSGVLITPQHFNR